MHNSADIPKYLKVFKTKNMAWCTEFVVWSLLEADKQLNTKYVTTLYPLLDTSHKASLWFSKKNNREAKNILLHYIIRYKRLFDLYDFYRIKPCRQFPGKHTVCIINIDISIVDKVG